MNNSTTQIDAEMVGFDWLALIESPKMTAEESAAYIANMQKEEKELAAKKRKLAKTQPKKEKYAYKYACRAELRILQMQDSY